MKADRGYPKCIITAKGTRWVEGGHPWIYAEEVLREEGACENGALCDAVSEKGKYLGTGFLSRESKIRLRLLSRNANDRFDEAFWRRRIRYAWDYRKSVMAPEDLGCCRVVFGEADGFPGLTVDRFSDILVVQTLSVGMERIKETLFPLLIDELRADGQEIRGIFERNDVRAGGAAGTPRAPSRRSAKTASIMPSTWKTGRRPAFFSTRSTTVWRWRGWRRASACSTALPTPVPLRSTPRWAAQRM